MEGLSSNVVDLPGYVQVFLSRLQGVSQTSNGWISRCPCTSHGESGDHHPSLHVTIGDHGLILCHCQVGCSFYEVIGALGLKAYQLRPHLPTDTPHPTLVSKPAPVGEDYTELKDKVYRRFLWYLDLSPEDKKGLKKRGFTDGEIVAGGYRTFTHHQSGEVLKKLLEEFGEEIYLVPGFVEERIDGSLKSVVVPSDIAGLCIPIRNSSNSVCAIKARRDSEPKYLYLSSGSAGRSPGSPIHFSIPPLGTSYKRVRVTEGELKADIATLRSETYTIGLPGVGAWWKCIPLLKSLNVQEVLVSFDWIDVQTKPPVREQCYKFMCALRESGFGVGVETW